MDPEAATDPPLETADETVTEAPSDPITSILEDGGTLTWVGGLSGALVIVALLVVAALRLRPSPPPVFEEPEEEVVPEEHRAPPPEPTVDAVAPPAGTGLVGRLRTALGRSRAALQERFDALFGGDTVDESVLDDLTEALLRADVGVHTTDTIIDELRQRVKAGEDDPQVLRALLREKIRSRLDGKDVPLLVDPAASPWVLLVVGVNGSGKTTTIGKLAARFRAEGRSVLLAAGDTYRAAAADQLAVWAERAGAELVRGDEGADPASVVYQALEAAEARGRDVVIIDTAGRLQTARPLMEQLAKIRRVIQKRVPEGPHETLLVLDGTMGQNALSQARLFDEATPLTGCAVTKLDGTAKGGMIITLAAEVDLPIRLIGIGEALEDLKDFDADAFAEALA
jgi:fused signal recognition particle receptor